MLVLLDARTTNPGDLSWEPLETLGPIRIYEYTPPEMVVERARDAEILLVNKVVLSEKVLEQLPELKCICEMATGYNNIDLEAASRRNIPVCNVVGYSTKSVAQQVFALLLALTNRVVRHDESVQVGRWAAGADFSYTLSSVPELAGKTLGIYGFGNTGQKVGEIAHAFGMQVLAHHRHPERDARPWVEFVDTETLFRRSDVLSLHAPLNEESRQVVNAESLAWMKPTALLINTARGGLVDEAALAEALAFQKIAGAGLDVLSAEPPPQRHRLIGIPNCIITPHMAWASLEARRRLIEETAENVRAFLGGKPRNQVNE